MQTKKQLERRLFESIGMLGNEITRAEFLKAHAEMLKAVQFKEG